MWIALVMIAWLLSGLGGELASAQATERLTLPIPPTWRIGWQHDGVNLVGFVLVVDGRETDLGAVTKDTDGYYKTPIPPLTPGNHIVVVLAYNATGRASPSSELMLVVSVAVPTPATDLRLFAPSP